MAALLQRLVPLVLLLNAAVVYGGNTTCIDPSVTWYYNAAGESPCELFLTITSRRFFEKTNLSRSQAESLRGYWTHASLSASHIRALSSL
jgi:hypothetical protein